MLNIILLCVCSLQFAVGSMSLLSLQDVEDKVSEAILILSCVTVFCCCYFSMVTTSPSGTLFSALLHELEVLILTLYVTFCIVLLSDVTIDKQKPLY